jgi:hypothetical protein
MVGVLNQQDRWDSNNAPENVGPPSWWWMTEETREVQADERDEDVLWAPEHILKVILLNSIHWLLDVQVPHRWWPPVSKYSWSSLVLLSQCCVPPTGARPTIVVCFWMCQQNIRMISKTVAFKRDNLNVLECPRISKLHIYRHWHTFHW